VPPDSRLPCNFIWLHLITVYRNQRRNYGPHLHTTVCIPSMSMQNESKTRSPLLLLLVLAALLINSPLAVSQADASPEQELLQLANQARAAQDLPPLKWDSALAHAAKVHLEWVLRNPGQLLHQYPGEPDLTTRGANAGAHFGTIAENIGAHGENPPALQQIWMTTPTHRANLLDPKLDLVGIAVVEQQGFLYAVEDFAHNAPVLTTEAVERQIEKLLLEKGFPPAESNEDARKTCAMPEGQYGVPRLVIRWDGSDISKLPDAVVQQLDRRRYSSAAVAACPSKQSNQQFTTYHIVVLFY